MAHFGIFCPPIPGHLNPMASVGRALIRRGHKVTLLGIRDVEAAAQKAGLLFGALGTKEYPLGALAESVNKLSSLSGLASLKYSVECACSMSNLILRDAPATVHREGIDALLVDQNEPAGGSVAERLGIPFLSVCTSLPLNREPCIPPPFVDWKFSTTILARARNQIGYTVADRLIAPIQAVLNHFRRAWKLEPIVSPNDAFSSTGTISQMPQEFDFPRDRLPDTFCSTGPWFDAASSAGIPFPWEKLDGRPIVYGSLGTLQKTASHYFEVMADACAALDAQLVLAGGVRENNQAPFTGNPIVVGYAPQPELLARASVVITHGGLNTTLQAMHYGVPAIAIPLTHDQPAIAARLARTGAGLIVPPSRLSVQTLRSAVMAALQEGGALRTRARELQNAIHEAGGVEAAADVAQKPGSTHRACSR